MDIRALPGRETMTMRYAIYVVLLIAAGIAGVVLTPGAGVEDAALQARAGMQTGSPAETPAASLPAHAVRGVNYAHIHRGGRGYGSQASEAELANLRGLGVDWIALTPFGYQQTADQDQIVGFDPDEPLEHFLNPPQLASGDGPSPRGRDRSLTDKHLADQVASAHAMNVKVMIKPHIWSRAFWQGDDWHGTIDQRTPEAHERWRKSYKRFILHYAQLAQETKADALCLGTELVMQTTQYPDEWRAIIRETRKIYTGKITYAAHWETEYEAIGFWDELDAIGISAYFPLDVADDASVEQIVAAWAPHKLEIAGVQARFDKPVVFLELGYRPATGAYREPWLSDGGQDAPMIQARAYDAAFRTFTGEPWWHGVFIWKAFTDGRQEEGHRDRIGFSFRGLPAEAVIQRWFAGG